MHGWMRASFHSPLRRSVNQRVATKEVARRASFLFSRSVERSETYGKGATTEAFPVRESSQFSRWLSGAIPPGMD